MNSFVVSAFAFMHPVRLVVGAFMPPAVCRLVRLFPTDGALERAHYEPVLLPTFYRL